MVPWYGYVKEANAATGKPHTIFLTNINIMPVLYGITRHVNKKYVCMKRKERNFDDV